ncbi:putative surface protein SACOL0050 [Hyla sarda]|uniref:putative surface protein SACOL0050 n=1 Tax=Hyla sarda TaxID=327740 RepID=UPI0024C38E4F|nr:putative surface protein SACOL0050 [Hyla sarda]
MCYDEYTWSTGGLGLPPEVTLDGQEGAGPALSRFVHGSDCRPCRSRPSLNLRRRLWVTMSSRRSGTSSKRKRTTPQKLKSRKLFAVSGNDLEPPSISRAKDDQDGFPETLHNRENVPKSHSQSLLKKESLSETPQNKENMPGSAQRGRGRPKGSKNKTFPVSPTRVYSVREGKPPAYSPKKDDGAKQENGVSTPHRGRGRPKGSVKVKPIGEIVPKKSRGRPKGSKNRKPTKAALLKLSSGPKKPGRGRPRKILVTNEVATPKQERRGRPKGSLNKVPSAKKLALLSGTHEIKKRGRPKKIHLHPSPVKPLTPKRPRGRPKSINISAPVPSIVAKDSEDENETHDDKEEDDGQKIDETDSDE